MFGFITEKIVLIQKNWFSNICFTKRIGGFSIWLVWEGTCLHHIRDGLIIYLCRKRRKVERPTMKPHRSCLHNWDILCLEDFANIFHENSTLIKLLRAIRRVSCLHHLRIDNVPATLLEEWRYIALAFKSIFKSISVQFGSKRKTGETLKVLSDKRKQREERGEIENREK